MPFNLRKEGMMKNVIAILIMFSLGCGGSGGSSSTPTPTAVTKNYANLTLTPIRDYSAQLLLSCSELDGINLYATYASSVSGVYSFGFEFDGLKPLLCRFEAELDGVKIEGEVIQRIGGKIREFYLYPNSTQSFYFDLSKANETNVLILKMEKEKEPEFVENLN